MPSNCTAAFSAGAAPAAQILKVVPYSAIQLCTYEAAKRGLRDREGHLSIPARLTAGALAGMTATLVRCSDGAHLCIMSSCLLRDHPDCSCV